MEEINDSLHLELLNFNDTKRKKWMTERAPYAVLFELTPHCNMHCIHCYLQNNHLNSQLSYNEIIKIIDILHEKGILFLTFTGGEVLTRKDFIDIYLYAKKKGFLIEIFTNAFLISEKIINVFKKYPPLLIDISLYGGCEETYYKITGIKGAYQKVVENCKRLVKSGIRVSLKSPILTNTIDELALMKKKSNELGVPFVYTFDIIPTIDKKNTPRNYQLGLSTILKYEFENYYEQIKKGEKKKGVFDEKLVRQLEKCEYVYSCNVALNSFVIDYNGNMCPCMKLRHKGINLLKNNFDDIWRQFKVYSCRVADENYKCKGCAARYFCDICPAEMDFLLGNEQKRPKSVCVPAQIRKKFYHEEITLAEALELAKKFDEYNVLIPKKK